MKNRNEKKKKPSLIEIIITFVCSIIISYEAVMTILLHFNMGVFTTLSYIGMLLFVALLGSGGAECIFYFEYGYVVLFI